MNCAGCHAYNGKGNMGPDLTDTYWRYGGLPVEIYKSIGEGRPQGMPAWGAALPPEDIWKLVAYIESFGGSVSAKDYEHARQGDQPGEQIAPEVLEQKP
jgi:cytochrome c oxidase cbb3-type subunit 3